MGYGEGGDVLKDDSSYGEVATVVVYILDVIVPGIVSGICYSRTTHYYASYCVVDRYTVFYHLSG